MLGWFHALMPKEERFFDLFARHSEAVLGGATALRAMLEGGNAVKSTMRLSWLGSTTPMMSLAKCL